MLWGGAGSSKSWSIAQRLIYRCLAEPGIRLLCVRQTKESLRDSVFACLRQAAEVLGLASLFEFTVSPLRIACLNGSLIMFSGLDSAEKIKSLVVTGGIWVEEANEIAENAFDQLLIRPRGGKYQKEFYVSFNPVSPLSWVKRRLVDASALDESILCLHTTYRDNHFIGRAYRSQIEMLKDTNPDYYLIYGAGTWGNLSGTIYGPPKLLGTTAVFDDRSVFGLDFGYNHKSALIKAQLAGNNLYLHECLYSGGLTIEDLGRRIVEMKLPRTAIIYADSARPDAIESLCRLGLTVKPCRKGPGSVLDGINWMKAKTIWVTPESSNLIRELQTYRFDTDRDGNPIDRPIEHDDDACDASRYACGHWFSPPTSTSNLDRRKLGI